MDQGPVNVEQRRARLGHVDIDIWSSGRSVLVPMILVRGMTVPVVHIVHVITMLHGFVPAASVVLVIVAFVHCMHTAVALVPVVVVSDMCVAVVQIVDMIAVLDRGMPAVWPMQVRMIGVDRVGCGCVHGVPPCTHDRSECPLTIENGVP